MVLDSRLKDEAAFAERARHWGATFAGIRTIVDDAFAGSPHAGLKTAFETAIANAAAKLVAAYEP